MSKYSLFPLFCICLFCCISQHTQTKNNFIKSDIFASVQGTDKVAILVVHFGTTHDDTRTLTIDAINKKIANAFPNVEIREAWTSRIIIRRIEKRGIQKQTPMEVLTQLQAEGYTHILIQSTNIIEGAEMALLRKEIAACEKKFKDIRVGNPLLYSPEDYESVINVITDKKIKDRAILLAGHGTYTPTTAQYAMMDYMLKAKGFNNYIMGTIEGFPSFDDAILQLKKSNLKKVTLMPFLFVAGEHVKKDIATDWKNILEKQGYQVSVSMKGLGELAGIQDIFVEHVRFISKHKYSDLKK